jgi:hypothetical protein
MVYPAGRVLCTFALMPKRCWGLLVLAFLVLAGEAKTQCATKGRPLEDLLRSDVVYPQERGEMQLELLPNLQSAPGTRTTSVGFAGQFGLSDSWQFQFDWDGLSHSRLSGSRSSWDVGSLRVGSKIVFMCMGHSAFDLSGAWDLELPTSTADGDHRLRMGPTLIFARDLPFVNGHGFISLITSVPLGHAAASLLPGETDGTEYQWDLGMFSRLRRFRVTGEFTVARLGDGSMEIGLTPGLIWNSPPWELAGGFFSGLEAGSTRGLLFHIVYEFGGDH